MSNETLGKLAMLGAVLLLGLLCWWSPPFGDGDDRRTFMRECQDNGMRHFQCVAIWRGGASMLIIPTPAYNYMLPVDPN